MNCSELIVDILGKKGLKDVFSVVGGHSLFINNAFHESNFFKVTYFHHEQAASMAADSYARIADIPAIVNVSAGPASLNTLNGLFGSFVDSIPVIYISGQPKLSQNTSSTGIPLRQYGDQEFDGISDLVSKITKYSIKLSGVDHVKDVIEKAYNISISGRPGPVWIDIPIDVQSQKISQEIDNKENSNMGYVLNKNIFLKKPTNLQIDFVLEKLNASKRPIIYAGPGVRAYGAFPAFYRLINILKIPVVTSWNAQDLIETNNKLFVGRPGLRGERCGNWIVNSSDLVLIFGEFLSSRQIGYEDNAFSDNCFKIMVEHDFYEINKPNIVIDLPINSDLSCFLDQLSVKASQVKFISDKNWLEKTRKTWERYKPAYKDYPIKEKINPYHFLFKFYEKLDNNKIVILGNGISVVGSFQTAIVKKGQRNFQNYGSASMGYDLPACIGAHVAGGGHIVCLTGDGSIQLNLQELQTLQTLKAKVSIFVINNNGYDSIRQSQKMAFADSSYHGISPKTGISFPSIKKLAECYEYDYFLISSYSSIENILDDVFESKTSICEIIVDDNQDFLPKVSAMRNEDGSIKSGSLLNMKPFMRKEDIKEILDYLKSE